MWVELRGVGRYSWITLEKQKSKQVKTYNLTRSQLHNAVRQVTEEDLKRIKQEAMEDAINTAMTLLLVLPMTGKRPMQRRYQSLQSWYYSTMNAGKMES